MDQRTIYKVGSIAAGLGLVGLLALAITGNQQGPVAEPMPGQTAQAVQPEQPLYPVGTKIYYEGNNMPREEGSVFVDTNQWRRLCETAGISEWAHEAVYIGGSGSGTPAVRNLMRDGMIDTEQLVWEDRWIPGKECRLQVTVSGVGQDGNTYRGAKLDVIVGTFKINPQGKLIAYSVSAYY